MCLHHYSYSLAVALERNDCSTSPEDRCDFVCDCQDCSDEQDCGKILNVYMVIPSGSGYCIYVSFSWRVYWLNGRLSGTGLCVWFWAWGEVWMDCPVRWRWVRVAETAEREHASWQRAVLWLHHWHFHRYKIIQLTLPAGVLYIYKALPNPVIEWFT